MKAGQNGAHTVERIFGNNSNFDLRVGAPALRRRRYGKVNVYRRVVHA